MEATARPHPTTAATNPVATAGGRFQRMPRFATPTAPKAVASAARALGTPAASADPVISSTTRELTTQTAM